MGKLCSDSIKHCSVAPGQLRCDYCEWAHCDIDAEAIYSAALIIIAKNIPVQDQGHTC